jgi:predicted outer membrane protein
MRVNARSLVACLLISALVPVSGCRDGRADEDEHDTLGFDTTASWSEPAVFGFADAAFSLLLNDAEIGMKSARRAPVKQLATRMQREYRALAARTDSLSDQRSVVPRSPSALDFAMQHRSAAADLRNEGRRPFDERYLDHVVTGHQRIMDRMYEALSAAQDESVRRLLEDAQRRLETNLAEATRLKTQAGRATTRLRT